MRAALLEAPGQDLIVVADVEIDGPRTGEVLVAVTHCGVCHSDLHVADGSIPFPLPAILGHEAAGVVTEVGLGVDHLAPGDPVLLSPRPPCGRCYHCQRAEYALCRTTSGLMTGVFPDGSTRLHQHGHPVFRGIGLAAFAEQVVIPATGAITLPRDLPLEIACVLGCAVQTGVGAVLNTARVETGATVLVVGLGGIGISIVMGATLAGASRIIGVDPVASRRDRAAAFGATQILDPGSVDVVSAVLETTGGIGADYTFDAVGNAALVETCMLATRDGGTTVMVGVPPLDQQIRVPGLAFVMGEKKLKGCFLGSSNPQRDVPLLISLYRSGRLDLDGLITSRRPLEAINDAFADQDAGRVTRASLVTT